MPAELLFADPARIARDLATIDAAAQLLRLAAVRLTGLVARAGAASTAADWSAPSARAFGERADELRRAFARAEALADDAVAALARVRAEVSGRAWP